MQPGSRMIFKGSSKEVIQWRQSLVFCRHRRAHKAKLRTHKHTHASDTEENFTHDDKHADVRMGKCQQRLYFLIHSFFSIVFHHLYFLSLNLSNASALLHFSFLLHFNYSSHLLWWHFNQNKSVRLFPITDCHDSSRSKPQREQKCLKALLLCLPDSYLFIYLLIILETLPSKHISQKVWCVDFRWSRKTELHSSPSTKKNTTTTPTATVSRVTIVQGDNHRKKRFSGSLGESPVTGRFWAPLS